MLQTPTSLSDEICERPSHSIDFDPPYDRLQGGLISCSVAFGSAAIQVNWTLVTRHNATRDETAWQPDKLVGVCNIVVERVVIPFPFIVGRNTLVVDLKRRREHRKGAA